MMKYTTNDEITLSVIIPTCNRNTTLPKAINSVLNQNIHGLEIIVVNDSENVISDEILSIALTHPVVFTSNPSKHGAASTRNYGVSVAKGKYITFLDDDDIYLPGRLNNMLSLAKQDKYIMLSSGRFYEIGDFSIIKLASKQRFGVISLHDIQYHNDIDIGFMMKRDIFLSFGGFDTSYKSLEDWDFVLRVLEKGLCYKLERMDYVVNLEPSRPRVSDNDSESYLKMAEMYREKFGELWYSHMVTHGLSISGNLGFIKMVRESMVFLTYRPLLSYLRQIKRKLLS